MFQTMFQPEYKTQFDQDGYVVARSLFAAEEAEFLKYHYTAMSETGKIQGDPFNYPKPEGMVDDPLKRYPRILQLNKIDLVSVKWLIDARLNTMLTGLLDREPYAAHAMVYFKPPMARGQALHQDNYYLRARPGTCCAAWMALEDVDEENGCLQVVPGSHTWPTLCTVPSDLNTSFTDLMVPVPADTPLVSVTMKAGDVLFFNGQLVHGSFPNTSTNRFRRSLIGHYIEGDSQQIGQFYKPLLRMDGSEVVLEASDDGGPCGTWVNTDGKLVVEITGYEVMGKATE